MNKRSLLIVVVLFLLIWGCGHPQALYDDPPRSALEEGRMAEQKRDYVNADWYYHQIDNLMVRYMTLNQLHSAWNDVNANIVHAQQIARQQPNSANAHLQLADYYYQRGVLGTRYSRESVGIYPHDFLRGEQEHYYNTALEHAERALQLQPNMPEAYLLIGEIYLANTMYEKAMRALKRAITHNPDFARGYYAIGKLYVDQEQYELSERYFIKAIKLDSGLYDAYYLLGKVFLELALYDYAAHTFLEILRHNPQDSPAFDMLIESCHELAKQYIEAKQYAEAIQLLQEALQAKSDYDVHQTFLLAKAKQQEDEMLKEQQAAMEEMTEQETDTDANEFVDLLFADQTLETLIPHLDPKGDAEFEQALQDLENQRFQEAYTVLQAGAAKNRENPYRSLALAFAMQQLGREDEARQTLRSLTSATDVESRVQLWAWLALRSLGEQLDPNIIYRVLGVVFQVHSPETNSVEVLAAYLDGRVRHVTVNGQVLVWDRTEGDISAMARNVVYTAQTIARDFPSEQQREPLRENTVRISLLTVGGIRVLEENIDQVNTSVMYPVYKAGTDLLNTLMTVYNAT